MKILIDYRVLSDALFSQPTSKERINAAWSLLSSNSYPYIYGCISERGFNIIADDIGFNTEEVNKANRIIQDLKQRLEILEVDSRLAGNSRLLNIERDSALELACALKYGVDAILTKDPAQFRGLNLPIYVLDNEACEKTLKFRFNNSKVPYLLVGRLEDLAWIKTSSQSPTRLKNWDEHLFGSNWQPLEELILNLGKSISFRGSAVLENRLPKVTQRGRILEIKPEENNKIVLVLRYTVNSLDSRDIWVAICPAHEFAYLPGEIELMILDDNQQVFLEGRSIQNICLQFSGEKGERFQIKVKLKDLVFHVEDFVI